MYTQAFAQVCCIVIHIQIYSGVLYKFKYFLHYCGAMLAQHNYVWQKKKKSCFSLTVQSHLKTSNKQMTANITVASAHAIIQQVFLKKKEV